MEAVKLILIGVILGIANVIPGVSGGTIAVVFNVYDRLISVITVDVKKIFSMWKFWLPLGIGIAAGILGFSKLITLLFERYPVPTNWCFIGIILGSLPMIFMRAAAAGKTENGKPHVRLSAIIACAAAFSLMVIMAVTKPVESVQASGMALTPLLASQLFTAGMLAAIAMIIPGISGSFLLLAVGLYSTFIGAVASLNFSLLIPGGLGIAAGLLAGAGLVRFLMRRVPSQTYWAILGLVAGSVPVIYPGIAGGTILTASAAALAVGFILTFFTAKNDKSS